MANSQIQTDKSVFKRYRQITPAAKILGISVQTLRNWADKGKFPFILDNEGNRQFEIERLRRFKRDSKI